MSRYTILIERDTLLVIPSLEEYTIPHTYQGFGNHWHTETISFSLPPLHHGVTMFLSTLQPNTFLSCSLSLSLSLSLSACVRACVRAYACACACVCVCVCVCADVCVAKLDIHWRYLLEKSCSSSLTSLPSFLPPRMGFSELRNPLSLYPRRHTLHSDPKPRDLKAESCSLVVLPDALLKVVHRNWCYTNSPNMYYLLVLGMVKRRKKK